MKLFNTKLFGSLLAALSLSSCVIEYTPTGVSSFGYYGYSRSYAHPIYRPHHCYYGYRKPTITPVAHGFDPDPQYVRGYVFRGADGMPYAAEF